MRDLSEKNIFYFWLCSLLGHILYNQSTARNIDNMYLSA